MAAYVGILVLLAAAGAAVGTLYLASLWVSVNRTPLESNPFLGGGEPTEHAMARFHVRWYLVALLFLAFDMEMVFMYPWAVVFADIGMKAMIEMGMFLLVLLLGVLYAWREGALRWQ